MSSEAQAIRGIEAVIFDLDGTLVDSEVTTARAVDALLSVRAIPHAEIDYVRFHGLTWRRIDELLIADYPALAGQPLATQLQELFDRLLVADPPPPIRGAREAFIGASEALPTAIATSSNRQSLNLVLDALQLRRQCHAVVCAEDCSRSKPDPQCFLLAAQRLGRPPERCLVFEDSLAGLQAARAAGMTAVAITCGMRADALATARELAQAALRDFTELPAKFFSAICAEPAA